MSAISGLNGAGSASASWAASGGTDRAAAMKQRMFAKVDSNGDGQVDGAELQKLLDKMSQRTGQDMGKAADVMKSMDSNGDGSLSADELQQGMKSLMSTVDLAKSRDGAMGPPPGPPPDDGDGDRDAAQDGGQVSSLLHQIASAMDSNGDGTVSADEMKSFLAKVDTGLGTPGTAAASSPATASASSAASHAGQGADASQDGGHHHGHQHSGMGGDLQALLSKIITAYSAGSTTAASGAGGTVSATA
jgi:Ca2+-binding EF-hand superfamily protein